MNDSSISLKACRTCRTEFPVTPEHWHRSGVNANGFSTECKACRSSSAAARYKLKYRVPSHPVGMRTCPGCKITMLATTEFFYLDSYHGAFARCKKCCRDKGKRKRGTLDKPQVEQREGHKYCSACKQYFPASLSFFRPRPELKDGFCSNCRKCQNASTVRSSKKYPERGRAARANRRALKKMASGKFTAADVDKQFAGQQGKCYWCRRKIDRATPGAMHIDHLIPLTRGGSNGPGNIVCACAFCNLSRNNKLPHEWNGRLL